MTLFHRLSGASLLLCVSLVLPVAQAKDSRPEVPSKAYCDNNRSECEKILDRRQQFCKDNPRECRELIKDNAARDDRREERREDIKDYCKDNPKACEQKREELRDQRDERRENIEDYCRDNPRDCEKRREEIRERLEDRRDRD